MVSGLNAERTAGWRPVTRIERVRRPIVTSSRLLRWTVSSRTCRMGEALGLLPRLPAAFLRRATRRFAAPVSALLNVLHLFANSFELGLEFDHVVRERGIVCLAADGVRFAPEFL